MTRRSPTSSLFLFPAPSTTEIYPLSLHDALPLSSRPTVRAAARRAPRAPAHDTRHPGSHPSTPWSARPCRGRTTARAGRNTRSEEHTSELQSLAYLVCRLLLEKKRTFNPKINVNGLLSAAMWSESDKWHVL